MGFDPHRHVQAEPINIGAQRLARPVLERQRAPQGQHPMPSAGPGCAPVGDSRGLQPSQRASLLAVDLRLGQVGLARVLDQHAAAREHLDQRGDDGLRQSIRFGVSWCSSLDETRRAVCTLPVHPVQHKAVQVDVEVGRVTEALDQCDGAPP